MAALFTGVSWLAVGVGTILCFMLGGLWYSPKLFGTRWAEGVGVQQGPGSKQPVGALITQFAATLLLAWIIALAVSNGSYASALLIVIMATLLLMAGSMFHGNSNYATVTEGSFVVVQGAIMFVCQLIL